jgi:hypothetical protein
MRSHVTPVDRQCHSSSWLPTVVAGVRVRARHVGFVVDKVTLGQVFSEYFSFTCQSSFHQFLHHNHPGWHNRPIGGSSAEWTQLTPPPTIRNTVDCSIVAVKLCEDYNHTVYTGLWSWEIFHNLKWRFPCIINLRVEADRRLRWYDALTFSWLCSGRLYPQISPYY